MRYCGLTLNIFVIYAGYFIPTPEMPPSLRWIRYYLDPVSHAYEAILSNEFKGLTLHCSASHIIPRGPTYTPSHQTCAVPGSTPGSLTVEGSAYLYASYNFLPDRLLPNLAFILTQAGVFLFASILFSHWFSFTRIDKVKLFRDCKETRKRLGRIHLPEVGDEEMEMSGARGLEHRRSDETISSSEGFDPAALTFNDLGWTINSSAGAVDLLSNITGYIQPGTCTALMGASGAGKTTLLSVLGGRISGKMSGRILVDGRLPDCEAYKSIGFVGQFDSHDEKSTIKEALTFSALLRQPKLVPRWAKLLDVDRVLRLLGLEDMAEAIVGTLDLESFKRLSIAVELVARPRVLLVDEPVSGLEGRAAAHIIALLATLAKQTGLGVMVTIHQPSREMFESFDRLMLLERGGRAVYFGPRVDAVAWFEARVGARMCCERVNPAEYLIESVTSDALEEDEDPPVCNRGQKDRNSAGSIIVTDPRGRQSVIVKEPPALRWLQSQKAADVVAQIDLLDSRTAGYPATEPARGASSQLEEIVELTKRCSRHFWRDRVFCTSQIFTALLVGALIGLSFGSHNQKTLSMAGLKARMFSVFLVLFIPPVIMNQLIMKAFEFEAVYLAKEKPAGVYKKMSLTLGFLLAELPYCCASALVFWAIWFWAVGYSVHLETILFTFVAVQLFFLFQVTWAIWIAGLAPTIGVVANILPFFLVSMEAFNGSLIPYVQMPGYWRWMYWLSPFQWYIRAVLSVVLHNQPVRCAPHEWIQISPPPSLSCEGYMANFSSTGTLDVSKCLYCPLTTGDQFVDELMGQQDAYTNSYGALMIFSSYVLVNLGLIWVFGGQSRMWNWNWRRSGGKISL